jgi:very-short-patch-repair endonuclease
MESGTEKLIACDWLRYDVVNYAMQQNYVPVVRKVILTNSSLCDLHQVTVRITTEPEFAAEWTKTLDILPAGQGVDLGPVPLQLSGAFLAGLTERLTGLVSLEVMQGNAILYKENSPLTVLAYDQWGGLTAMPEMAAAFIMPNHPAVARIIGEAAPFLEKWTGNPSFDAYQSRNPNRARHQAAAIYSALQAHQPTYCVAPAGFEEAGQRVRLPDAVFANRMGNCLDLTLLYAACLEAVGLHPLAVFTKGHAFAGVWLIQETFSESVQDDVSLLTKRLAPGVHEISIVETTLMCAGSRSSYQEAESVALAHLDDPDSFFGFIDIKRARSSAIRPLPVRIPAPNGWEIVQEQEQMSQAVLTDGPEEVRIHERPVEVPAIAVTKQKQWERKLLDLTLRNTLLNFRLTKSALPLLNTRLNELEDALAEGQELQLLPKPSDWENTARNADLFQRVSKDHPLNVLIHQEFLHKRLRADAGDKELADKTIHLYRAARLSLEENGANTLYLALGLLKWYESPVSEMPRYAPLVLIPVELVRKSSSAGFILRLRDEEPQINITLLEMLRQDFGSHIGGLDPLPRDEKGIDLAGIFTTIRHVIMNMPRWDIVESAFLGLFSFSRFVMWNDIRSRAEDLARNKVVASLMAGRLEWEPGDPFPGAERLDELFSPEQLLLPISADSSQITAVSAANNGSSFVLHGPPGTGKSQTITNMIASALAGGQTVLFVAEKMAALSVVESRLAQIGLGPFCLELHSNKSTKKAVLEQLRLTLETARTASPEEWTRQADRLAASRKELNVYVSSLHKKYGFGASLHEAIARYGRVQASPGAVSFEPGVVGGMTQDQYTDWADLANELRVAGEAAGHPSGHVWADAACSAYTPSLRTQAEGGLAAYASKLAEACTSYNTLNDWLSLPVSQPGPGDLLQVRELAELLQSLPEYVPVHLLRAADVEAASAQIIQAVQHGSLRDDLRKRITSRFAPEALAFEAAPALAEWRRAELQWFLPKYFKQNRIYGILKGMAAPGSGLQKKDTPEALALMVQYQAETAALKQVEPAAAPLLGTLWNSGEADWSSVRESKDWIAGLQKSLLRLYGNGLQAGQARERLAQLLSAGREVFVQRYGSSITQFLKANQDMSLSEGQLASALRIDFEAMDKQREEQAWFDYRGMKVKQWIAHIGALREWCSWRQVRERAASAGLASLISAYEGGELQHAEVVPSFERAWWKAVMDYILAEDQQLASFSGRLFEEKIKVFQETVERFEKLTRQEIAARLAAHIPPLHNQAASTSEAGILLRAIRSGGRGMSLRKLFEQIPNLLSRICPCMLMSPMSVAQYLDPKYAPFDLVVFDEASQLPTSEAVGAMARGRHVIVVGDPKQLPPTSFFSNMANEDSDDAVVPEDLESILDDCLALGMPQEHLLWHYRSRHESLIAFSNRHFYENKLLTFPSPYERSSNVRWHPVDGYYDRGKTKQNRAEAEQVVAEIGRRLRDPELSKLSIGVVTFNSIQQTLIEDLLDEAFRKDSELEQAAIRLYEPVFVKNLENVQGDERDVILFSIGYGPDASGKVVLNFGPLNREGGWRRLNVAVSRARHEMHVFSSLRAEHLDVSRTRAQGVSALRSFLEYAEKGLSALRAEADQVRVEDTGMESQLAEALIKEGFKVDLHVGASGYRIDLGIVNPDKPDTYLLAVLCDGISYKAGRTARDREVLRGQILRQLGWSIHRVWSMDWLDNPEREIQRIRDAVKAAGVRAGAPAEARAAVEPAPQVMKENEPVYLEKPAAFSKAPERSAAPSLRRTGYKTAVLPVVELPPEEFYNTANARIVSGQMSRIVREEGPISRPLLTRRLLQAWGMTRSGARIERHLDSLIAAMKGKKTVWDGVDFYWPEDMNPDEFGVFRVAESEQERRNAEDLPPEEIANAVKEVLFHQVSLPVEDLIKETVKLMGYSRTGTALDKAVRNGLQVALSWGTAELEGGRVCDKKA